MTDSTDDVDYDCGQEDDEETLEFRLLLIEARLIEVEKTCKKYEDYLIWFNKSLEPMPLDKFIEEMMK